MLRNKQTPLPLHHGGPLGNGSSINAALDKGLNLVGLAATKTGSGEKERAYVVKQNSLLKGLLCLVFLGFCVSIIVFSTVLELKIARRGLIMSEAIHFKREHHDHEEIFRTTLELQEALEATIEETTLLEEFRAYFDKHVGQTNDKIDRLFQELSVPPTVIVQARTLQAGLVKSLETRLDKIINRFHKRAMVAGQQIIKLAQAMGREIDDDAKLTKKYEERLKKWGVDEQYAEKLEEQYDEEQEGEEGEEDEDEVNLDDLSEEEKKMSAQELKAKREQEEKDHQEEAEKEVEAQLEVFFTKLEKLDLPEIPPEKIAILEKTLQDMLHTLQDETKETDLEMVAKKMEEAIQAHAPGSLKEKFDSGKHDSMIDFYSGFIERAKLYPHRTTLMDLYNGWKSPDSKITSLNLLASIENVAFKEHLMKIFDLLEGNDMDPTTDTEIEHESDAADSNDENNNEEAQATTTR